MPPKLFVLEVLYIHAKKNSSYSIDNMPQLLFNGVDECADARGIRQ